MVARMTAVTDEIAEASTDIAQVIQTLFEVSQEMENNVKRIDEMTQFVDHIASQSHFLGINVAIEAARAGNHGRGFAVVMDEIRKMADQSRSTVKTILDLNMSMNAHIRNVLNYVETAAADTEEHAATVQELKSLYVQIAATSNQLVAKAAIK